MGCLESKSTTDNVKLQIPSKTKKNFNGSVRSRHDFGVQTGTPFSKKRALCGKPGVNDDNDNYVDNPLLENDVVNGIAVATEISNNDDNQSEMMSLPLQNGNVAVLDQKETTEKAMPKERGIVSEEGGVSEGHTLEEVTISEVVNASGQQESPITLQQKWLVQDSWAYIEKDLLEYGMVFFARLLDENPTIRHLWSFGKMNYATEAELRADTSFQNHSRQVMEMIGRAIQGLDDLELLVPIISDLGQRHRMYGAKPEHFTAVHAALMYSYKKGLDEKVWTADVNEAWDAVIGTVAKIMSAELKDE
ncbi:uncharacterized protein [Antedon mediterranea]|uniref:uncharacterized protein n=1 Tax=Antedon mediterranea TaxID=105859 RepID=UPI003AF49C71